MKHDEGLIVYNNVPSHWHGRLDDNRPMDKRLMSAVCDRNTFIRAHMATGHTYKDAVREYKEMMKRLGRTR